MIPAFNLLLVTVTFPLETTMRGLTGPGLRTRRPCLWHGSALGACCRGRAARLAGCLLPALRSPLGRLALVLLVQSPSVISAAAQYAALKAWAGLDALAMDPAPGQA